MRAIYIFLIILSMLVACSDSKKEENKENIIQVKVAKVEVRELNFPYQAAGIIASEETIKLAFKIGGIIKLSDCSDV